MQLGRWRWWDLALVGGGLFVAAALWLWGGPPDAASLLKSAKARIEARDTTAAMIDLKNLFDHQPQSAEGRFLLGKAHLLAGNPAGAEVELQRALEYGHSADDVVPLLARAMLVQGKAEAVIQTFGATRLSTRQAHADLKKELARAYLASHEVDEAGAAIGAALQAVPEDPAGLELKARIRALGGDLDGAFADAQVLTTTAPKLAAGWQLKADLLWQRDAAPAEVESAYRKALELEPDLAVAHQALVGMAIARRDLTEADSRLAAMKKALPGHREVQYLEGIVAFIRGDYARTRDLTQQLLRRWADEPRYLLLAGQTDMALGAWGQAETMLARAMAAAPQQRLIRLRLAKVHLTTGQTTRGLETLAPLVGTDSVDIEALNLAGDLYLQLGDAKRADASFGQAARVHPQDARASSGHARSLLALGRADAALQALETSAQANNADPTAHLALIATRLRRREFDAALTAIDELAAKMPKSAQPDFLRGQVAIARGDAAVARRHFESGLAKEPSHPPSLWALAALDQKEGTPERARARFEKVLEREPDNVPVLLALADLLSRLPGLQAAAAQLLERSVVANAPAVGPRVAAAELYLRIGSTQKAVAAAQSAAALFPKEPMVLDVFGRAQLAAGNVDYALKTFTRLNEVSPKSALPHLRLSEAYMAAGKAAEADNHAARALALAPDWIPAQGAAAAAALRQGHPDKARAIARAIQTRQPTDALGFRVEGDIEAGQKRWDAAVVAFRKALGKSDPDGVASRLYWALASAGKSGEAEELATTWLREHPKDVEFLVRRAEATLMRNDMPGAEAAYRRVLDIDPQHAVAQNNVAYLMVVQKEPGALEMAKRAAKAGRDSADSLDTLAQAFAAEQAFDDAIEAQRKAVALAPDKAGLRLNLAKLYLRSARKEKARDELEVLAKLGKSFSAQAEVDRLRAQAEK